MGARNRFIEALTVGALVAAPAAAIEVSPYGFIKAGMVAASSAADSYGNQNLSAPIRAFPAAGHDARSSFQLSQSRAGVHIARNQPVSAQLEVDFIDFAKASPVVKAVPRLRVATIRYAAGAHDTFAIGQDWDLFSPVKPHTFNFVGLYFGAGNAGFIRPQLTWTHSENRLTYAAGLGLPGSNGTPTDSDLERGLVPSLSSMIAYSPDEGTRFGISAIVGRLHFAAGSGGFYGINAFVERKLGAWGEIHGEIYHGQNLANVGALTLATGVLGEARHEWGGYVTAKAELFRNFSSQLGIGYAGVSESNGSVLGGVAGYRVRDNLRVSAAAVYRIAEPVELFLEVSSFKTGFVEETTVRNVSRSTEIVDCGAVFSF